MAYDEPAKRSSKVRITPKAMWRMDVRYISRVNELWLRLGRDFGTIFHHILRFSYLSLKNSKLLNFFLIIIIIPHLQPLLNTFFCISNRFASFIEGNSHLMDEEIFEYETSHIDETDDEDENEDLMTDNDSDE